MSDLEARAEVLAVGADPLVQSRQPVHDPVDEILLHLRRVEEIAELIGREGGLKADERESPPKRVVHHRK